MNAYKYSIVRMVLNAGTRKTAHTPYRPCLGIEGNSGGPWKQSPSLRTILCPLPEHLHIHTNRGPIQSHRTNTSHADTPIAPVSPKLPEKTAPYDKKADRRFARVCASHVTPILSFPSHPPSCSLHHTQHSRKPPDWTSPHTRKKLPVRWELLPQRA